MNKARGAVNIPFRYTGARMKRGLTCLALLCPLYIALIVWLLVLKRYLILCIISSTAILLALFNLHYRLFYIFYFHIVSNLL